MAGLVAAIHVLLRRVNEDVDAGDKPWHDDDGWLAGETP
jgi:hypothetical protein